MAKKNKLQKNLKLLDVYAIATGAMFSSGFFLLPGLAAFETGPSAYIAYLVAGFAIIPSMLCMAELSTAMPKAGGLEALRPQRNAAQSQKCLAPRGLPQFGRERRCLGRGRASSPAIDTSALPASQPEAIAAHGRFSEVPII